jgi:hypothetical protein
MARRVTLFACGAGISTLSAFVALSLYAWGTMDNNVTVLQWLEECLKNHAEVVGITAACALGVILGLSMTTWSIVGRFPDSEESPADEST